MYHKVKQTYFGEVQDIVKSYSFEQDEILQWIMRLYCPDGFELDPTYSIGNFYKTIPKPKYKFDLYPQIPDVAQADCRSIPLAPGVVSSIMFDPPFVAAQPTGQPTGIITQRFGYYKNIQTEMWGMYHDALKEFYRILRPEGFLVVKCQDVIDSSKQYLSHVEIINCALNLGFYPKDLFILLAKNRLTDDRVQQHARKFHCYFLVFQKTQSKAEYTKLNVP